MIHQLDHPRWFKHPTWFLNTFRFIWTIIEIIAQIPALPAIIMSALSALKIMPPPIVLWQNNPLLDYPVIQQSLIFKTMYLIFQWHCPSLIFTPTWIFLLLLPRFTPTWIFLLLLPKFTLTWIFLFPCSNTSLLRFTQTWILFLPCSNAPLLQPTQTWISLPLLNHSNMNSMEISSPNPDRYTQTWIFLLFHHLQTTSFLTCEYSSHHQHCRVT